MIAALSIVVLFLLLMIANAYSALGQLAKDVKDMKADIRIINKLIDRW